MGSNRSSHLRLSKRSFPGEIFENRQLYIMALPGLIFFLIFSYIPIYGLQLAFKEFDAAKGIWASPWIGFKNFQAYFGTMYFGRTTFNTLFLNTLFIITLQSCAILFALLLNEIRNNLLKRTYQSVLFFPYFLSWIIVAAITYNLFDEQFGTLNNILTSLGYSPVMWNYNADLWVLILVIANLWKALGLYIIIYMAAITSIDAQLYEASKIDGSKRFQEMVYITLPQLLPTIITMIILALGKIFYGNFEMIYALVGNNGQLFPRTDVIDTFVYRTLAITGDTGTAAAVGLYQSLLGFILVMLANRFSKKISEGAGLF